MLTKSQVVEALTSGRLVYAAPTKGSVPSRGYSYGSQHTSHYHSDGKTKKVMMDGVLISNFGIGALRELYTLVGMAFPYDNNNQWTPAMSDRHVQVLAMRDEQKMSFRDIGKAFGFSAVRAASVYTKAVERKASLGGGMVGLSWRTANCLNNIGYNDSNLSRDVLTELVTSGNLSLSGGRVRHCGSPVRNMGAKSFNEILRFLGMESSAKVLRRPVWLPICGTLPSGVMAAVLRNGDAIKVVQRTAPYWPQADGWTHYYPIPEFT